MPFANKLRIPLLAFFITAMLTSQAQNESFEMTQIGPNNLLTTPWDLNYGPDDYLWITERSIGVILRIDPETGERDELIQIPEMSSSASQDGLLGMALDKDFEAGSHYVYCSYTYLMQIRLNPFSNPITERRQRIVRYTYEENEGDGVLSDQVILLDSLPSSNDHNSGRLVFGPDDKLYYSIGDQGGNQNRNYCNPILSQSLPTQEEIDAEDWTNYPGKILRLNLDGSIPDDNPVLEGVQSHIYSYGHRNPQGLVFGNNGLLYSDEHGPNTDDEVNMIESGTNYGWPNVVGFQDDQAYDYCDWSTATNCAGENYSNGSCPESATLVEESSFIADNYKEPLFSMFAVTDDYNYDNPACGNSWICRPNVAPSSIGIYESDAIPSFNRSLLVTSLKRGRVYLLKLDEQGTSVVGDTAQLFYTQNRYRDIAIHPDGKTFFLITDQGGRTADAAGLNATGNLQNPGAILKFTLEKSTTLNDQVNEKRFRVWPNPTSSSIHFELRHEIGRTFSADLINTSGQIVHSYKGLSAGIHERSVSDFPAGMYTLRLYDRDGSWQKRVVIF
ncbi:MAG: T9SS type A sorting domain-containing protein [Saprospiraceae bacterium]|nr:T9SS type A sorting domain-containing protein [Saprospiraceae bacterium]